MTDSTHNQQAEFPSEEDWLNLPCPEVSAKFVENTLDRVRDLSDEIPRELLDAYEVPDTSSDFVARTMSRYSAERSPSWRRVLKIQATPEPSPDFVDRVLDALRQERGEDEPAPVLPMRRFGWIAAAAAAVLVAALMFAWPTDTHSVPSFEVLASRSFSHDAWGTSTATVSPRGLALARTDAVLQLGQLAGLGGSR